MASFGALGKSTIGSHTEPDSVSKARTEKEVRSLFQTATVEDVRMREANTRKTIEEKRQELRKLVGTRYRDLIDSADSIVDMRGLASNLLDTITKVEDHCTSLRKRRRQQPEEKQQQEKESVAELRKKKYFLGKEIKFLVDTPEKIWSALQVNDYLGATSLYLSAERVYSNLRKANDPYTAKILASIPLLLRQWGIIQQFPPKILASSRQHLLNSGLNETDYAGSLCAVALLDQSSSVKVFQEFLDARTKVLLSALTQDAPSSAPGSASGPTPTQPPTAAAVTERLVRVVETVHATLLNAKVIFHAAHPPALTDWSDGAKVSPSPAGPLLTTLLAPILAQMSASTPSKRDAKSKAAPLGAVDPAPVPLATLRKSCHDWLQRSAADIKSRGKVLLDGITKAQDLKVVEDGVMRVLNTPYRAAQPTGSASSAADQRSLEASGSSGRVDGSGHVWNHDISLRGSSVKKLDDSLRGSGSSRSGLEETEEDRQAAAAEREAAAERQSLAQWNELCALMVDGAVDLWTTIFQDMFMQRSKEIIAMSFARLSIVDVLEQNMQQLRSPAAAADVDVGSYIWSKDDEESIPVTKQKAAGITASLESVIESLDAQLDGFMQDINHLLRFPASAQTRSNVSSEIQQQLHAFIQQTCFEAIAALADQLGKRLDSVRQQARPPASASPSSTPSDAGADSTSPQSIALQQALFIGRLCRAISQHSVQLRKILTAAPATGGLAKSQNVRPPTRFLAQSSPFKKKDDAAVNPLFAKAQQQLYRHYLASHVLWALHMADITSAQLQAGLYADNLVDIHRKSTWEEMSVTVETEENKTAEEKIQLPFQPSSYVLHFLFAVCKDIHRTGGHTLDKPVLQYVVYELSERVAAMYGRFVSQLANQPKNKEGLLQLLYDVLFLSDALSGRKDVDSLAQIPALADAVAAVKGRGADAEEPPPQPWRLRSTKLLHAIEDELDPIDVAFYSPHLRQSVQRGYKRAVVLFGSLVQLHRLHAEVKTQRPGGQQEQHNVLVLAPLAPRLPLLPITMPAAKTAQPASALLSKADLALSYVPQESSAQPSAPKQPQSLVDRIGTAAGFGSLGSMFATSSSEKKPEKGKSASETSLSWW